jgi:hypothetical protein
MPETHPSFASASSIVVAFLYEAAATNALSRVASVLALGIGLTSCVPAKSYDEARTAAETEFTAHARTRARLETAHQRVQVLEQTLAERERALETGESSAAEAKLETIVLSKDKEAALALVEQLRSELARTGSHLHAYSDEKRDLARALMLAEERVRAIEAAERNLAELVTTASALSLALGPSLEDGSVEIGARAGEIVVSVPSSKLFAEGSDALVVDAAPVLGAVAKVSVEHTAVRVVLRAPEGAPLGEQRVMRLGAALRDRGVPESRLVLPSVPTRSEEPAIAPDASAKASPSDPNPANAPAPGDAAPAPSVAEPAPEAPARYEIAFTL